MGKFRPHPMNDPNPTALVNRKFRALEQTVNADRSARRLESSSIGDEYTMTPEGPKESDPMPTPGGLSIAADTERIKVVWSGTADAQIPTNFGRLAVHASKFTGYTPTQGTEVATVSSPYGGSALYAADGGDTYYIRCAIASLRGDYGPFTPEVAVTPTVAADPDTFEGDIVGGSISIATVSAGGDVAETFSGSTWPTGWSFTWGLDGGTIPAPTATSAGVPAGSDNGSAILFDYGPAGYPSGSGTTHYGTVGMPVAETVDAEAVVRFRHSTDPGWEDEFTEARPSERLTVALRADVPTTVIENGITLELAQANPKVAEVVGFGRQVLGSAAYPSGGLVGGVWYTARLRVVGGRLEAAVWADGAPEPDPALFLVENRLTPGSVLLGWEQRSSPAPVGLDTFVDSVSVSRYATGFTVLPDGTARMTRAEIDTMPTKLQAGQVAVTVAAASTRYTQAVTFPEPFNEVPEVMVTPYVVGVETAYVSATGITATGFTLNYYRTNTANMTVGWTAAAP